MERNDKKKSTGKEILMIALVVVLAFGLTVGGIVYLTKFLIGDDKPAAASATPPAAATTDNDSAVPFDIGSSADNNTIVITADNTTPLVTAPAAPPPPVAPLPPAAVTPPPVVKPPVTPPATVDVPSAAATGGKYQLQLFAFRSEASAKTEAQKLVQYYPDIFVMKADLGANGVWYRVRCCSTDSREEAAAIKADMEKKHKIKADIVNAR